MARPWHEIKRLHRLNQLREAEATIAECTLKLREMDEDAEPEVAMNLQAKRQKAALKKANLQVLLQEV